MNINNYQDLVSHGDRALRADLLSILSYGVDAVDPGLRTRDLVQLTADTLRVGQVTHSISEIKHIYVVGTGKGSYPIAQALEEILGERITDGVLAVKNGDTRTLSRIRTIQTGHPIPDQNSIEAAYAIQEILQRASEGDIVLAAITGGASAMTVLPPDGISLHDLQTTNELLLKSGGTIREMNTVRRHLCELKGGKLVRLAQPAQVYTMTLETVSDDIMPWPDMSKADPTTFQDALQILEFYRLTEIIPSQVRDYLEDSVHHIERETIKSLDGMRHALLNVGDPRTACEAAARKSTSLGYQAVILATHLEGDSCEAGIFLAGVTHDILKYDQPFHKPCALITGGETTVTIQGQSGRGGPNMELVLSYLNYMRSYGPWAIAAIDTDGTDGPTIYAGAIADRETKKEIASFGFSIKDQLKQHASETVFVETKNIIQTGHTGTNVMNLRVILIGEG